MPAGRRRPSPLLQLPRDQKSRFDGPAKDRLVANLDPALRQLLLNVPKTEAEPEVQPKGVTDHARRKPVAPE
jgi:hypothetical protein